MNNITITGRLTKDVESNQTKDTLFTRFTLAVYRDKEHTDFIPCVAFNKNAEALTKYTSKGSQIGIEGRLQSGKYTNKNGKNIYTLDVIVNRVELLGTKTQENTTTHESNTYQEPTREPIQQTLTNDGYDMSGYSSGIEISTDDLPFY